MNNTEALQLAVTKREEVLGQVKQFDLQIAELNQRRSEHILELAHMEGEVRALEARVADENDKGAPKATGRDKKGRRKTTKEGKEG